MGAPKKRTHEEGKKCPECGGVVTSANVVVKVKGWKAYYICKKGHETPTKLLR